MLRMFILNIYVLNFLILLLLLNIKYKNQGCKLTFSNFSTVVNL